MVRTRRGSRSRTATRAHGSEWSPSTRMLPMVRATATRAGKSSIRRNGCPTVMSACVSTPAARAARPVPSITSRRANRVDVGEESRAPPLDGDYRRERSPLWDKITVPFRSAANWGGQGLHPRGNFEGFVRAASKDKWLEAHGLEHWTHFYTDYGVKLQKRFFDCFLKGLDNDWSRQPRVQLQVRRVDRFVLRHEDEWPIARTQWTKFYLSPADQSLGREPVRSGGSIAFDAQGDGVTFISAPLDRETEITGPLASKLFVSSSTADADMFLVFRVFTPDLREVVF